MKKKKYTKKKSNNKMFDIRCELLEIVSDKLEAPIIFMLL